MGVSPAHVADLVAQDIDTLAKLAYSAGVQPGGGDEAPFLKVIATAWKVEDPNAIPLGQLAAIRRCWYEAHTVAIAEIRDRVQRTEGSEPARIPVPERESRLREQQQRLAGVEITSQLEPSHQLVDFCNQLRTDEQLRYICPSKCTSREQEIKGVRSESFLKQQTDGSIKVVAREDSLSADLAGEFKVRLALQRRSLAMDVVKIAVYSEMESYHSHLFNLHLADVPDSHEKIGLQQILQADKMVFARMTEHTRAGISQKPDGSYPIHNALKLAMIDPIVIACLQPLPKSRAAANIGQSMALILRQRQTGIRAKAQARERTKESLKEANQAPLSRRSLRGLRHIQTKEFLFVSHVIRQKVAHMPSGLRGAVVAFMFACAVVGTMQLPVESVRQRAEHLWTRVKCMCLIQFP